jgi:PAS domain S-box-containing protein
MPTAKLVQERLRTSEIRYRRLFETGRDGILVLDAASLKIVDVNPFMLELLSYPQEYFLGKELWEVGLFSDKTTSDAALEVIQGGGYLVFDDLPVRTSTGEAREVEFVSNVYHEGDKKVVQCNIHDITDRKEAERAQMRLIAIEQASEDAIIGKDLTGVITSWNTAAEKMFGYLREEVIGKPINLIIPPGREHEEALFLARIAKGQTISHFETIRVKQDGTEIDVSITITPVLDVGGRVLGANKIARDITLLKRTMKEIRQLNTALEKRVNERTSELEAVNKELEAFSYSVSHDLRAPLRHINGFSKALLEDYSEQLDDEGKGHLNQICEASLEMGQLIDEVLELARITRSDMRRENFDISDLARSVANDVSKADAAKRKVAISIQDGLTAFGDKRLIGIALTNLLGNAWKFTSKKKTAAITFGFDGMRTPPEFFVRDNGAGFDMAYADKLFGAFQRLHSTVEFEGTGVGLATVQRIVHRHGGEIRAEAAVGEGATLYFTLPAAAENRNDA